MPKLSESNVQLFVGDSASLECTPSQQDSIITWYFNDTLINADKGEALLKPNGNSLFISNASLDLFGEIKCKARTVRDNTTHMTEVKAKLSVSPPIIAEINPPMIRVNEGEIVNLNCSFTLVNPSLNNSELSFLWIKDGVAVTGVDQSTYSFEAKSRFDAGNYSCQVFDPVSKAESNLAQQQVKVGSDDPPEMDFDSILVNDDYILRCKVNSYANLSSMEITRVQSSDDETVVPHLEFGNASAQYIEIHILDTPSNYGFFKCSAENNYGDAYSVLEIPRCELFQNSFLHLKYINLSFYLKMRIQLRMERSYQRNLFQTFTASLCQTI
jgi:hypothetical protein